MSSRTKSAPVKPWMTPKTDARKIICFVSFDADLLQHPAFVALNRTAQITYFALAASAKGNSEFTMPYLIAEKYGISESSYTAALKELVGHKFIRVASGKPTRQVNRITFINDWKTTSPTKKKALRGPRTE